MSSPHSIAPLSDTGSRWRVLWVGDCAPPETGFLRLLFQCKGIELCGEASTPATALEAALRLNPDMVLVGSLPGRAVSGELLKDLKKRFPRLPAIELSACGTTPRDLHEFVPEGERFSEHDPVRPMSVSIVIPTYNAELSIAPLIEALVAELSTTYQLQLLIVDDGSSDGTAIVCKALQEKHPALIEFLGLSRNFGEHNAVMAGLHRVEGDYCVIMDDDFQNPPGEVRKLLEEIRKGHDVVYAEYETKHHSPLRNLGSRLHNSLATRALGKPAGLYLSSFKALSRFLVRETIGYTGPDPYLDGIILRITRKIGRVKVRHQPRQHGKSGYSFGKLISLWGNMIVAFSLYPLRLLGLYGLVMVTLGGGVGLWTFGRYLFDSLPNPDSYERLTATLWFFRGVQLLFISVVGEYVGRIYQVLQRDPQFVVRTHIRRRNL